MQDNGKGNLREFKLRVGLENLTERENLISFLYAYQIFLCLDLGISYIQATRDDGSQIDILKESQDIILTNEESEKLTQLFNSAGFDVVFENGKIISLTRISNFEDAFDELV